MVESGLTYLEHLGMFLRSRRLKIGMFNTPCTTYKTRCQLALLNKAHIKLTSWKYSGQLEESLLLPFAVAFREFALRVFFGAGSCLSWPGSLEFVACFLLRGTARKVSFPAVFDDIVAFRRGGGQDRGRRARVNYAKARRDRA